jgi:hypothetical protein
VVDHRRVDSKHAIAALGLVIVAARDSNRESTGHCYQQKDFLHSLSLFINAANLYKKQMAHSILRHL